MSFWDRLDKLMMENDISQRKLAKIVGLSQPSISSWQDGTIPRADQIIKIARHFGVSVEYLIEGEGKGGKLVQGAHVKGKNIIPFSPSKDDNIVYISYYDVAASAGYGVLAPDYAESAVVPVLRSFIGHHNPNKVSSVVVAGDSMTKIHMYSGDVVFFVPDETRAEGLYVIRIDDRLYVKRLEYDILGTEIRVKSENDRYSTQVLKGEDMNRLQVVGKVIGWITRHPY